MSSVCDKIRRQPTEMQTSSTENSSKKKAAECTEKKSDSKLKAQLTLPSTDEKHSKLKSHDEE